MTSKRITRARNFQLASILIATTMVFAVVAHAESAKSHRKGTLNIKTEAVVEGTTLPPGVYDVREVSSEYGPAVEFVRRYWNEAASELVQAEEDQLIATVPVIEQPTKERPVHTKLQLSADNKTATSLEIGHVPVDYVFEGTATASHPDVTENSRIGMQ